MRRFIAWFLLSIAAFQWLGSYFSFEILQSYVVEYQMDHIEKMVATSIKSETGVDLHLKSTTEDYINIMGYSNTFIVSKEIDGEQEFFRVMENAYEVKEAAKIINEEQQQNQKHDAALFKSILSEFVVAENLIANNNSFIFIRQNVGFINDLVTLFSPSIPTPPPEIS